MAKTVIARLRRSRGNPVDGGTLRCGTIAGAICGTASPVGVVRVVSQNNLCPKFNVICLLVFCISKQTVVECPKAPT